MVHAKSHLARPIHVLMVPPVMRSSEQPEPIVPSVDDFVLVPSSALLRNEVLQVVGLTDHGRVIVRAVRNPNLTATLARRQIVLPEHCREHADCVAHPDLGVECARDRRQHPPPLAR